MDQEEKEKGRKALIGILAALTYCFQDKTVDEAFGDAEGFVDAMEARGYGLAEIVGERS